LKISLLISTYNWPEALDLVLLSVEKLTVKPDELLLADDGSTPETTNLINAFKKRSSIPVNHVWHQDKGFNRSAILNKAIAQSTSDYIIQTDGDCILHPSFVKDHKSLAKKNRYLFGSRVSINEKVSPRLLLDKKIKFNFFSPGVNKRLRAIRIPLFSIFFKPKKDLSKKIRGCNISYWKKDFVSVNGYNEDMTGWGREDSELITRMINKGCIGKRVRYCGLIYHIWHPPASKASFNKNDQIQKDATLNKTIRCENGIDKYL
jgi:glycosyltransferase involved in cell wall biosynthesis